MIDEFDLPREAIPTQWFNEVAVRDALLQRMPLTAFDTTVPAVIADFVRGD